MNKCVFLDRDGTLIKEAYYPSKVKQIKFIKDNIKGLKIFQSHKFIIIIISNQSGIARKILTLNQLKRINKYIISKLKKNSITIKKIYCCTHHPDQNCNCRKPKIKFAIIAKKKFNIDMKSSLMIGNSIGDKKFAEKTKLKYYKIGKKYKSILDVSKNYFK